MEFIARPVIPCFVPVDVIDVSIPCYQKPLQVSKKRQPSRLPFLYIANEDYD
jgi:hypothetical protein